MKEKIEEIYNSLQELDMKPTPHNVSIMVCVFEALRELYQRKEETEDGRAQADSE